MLNWISSATADLVEENVLTDGELKRCKLCKVSAAYSKRRIRIHIRQHLVLMFCKCGFHHASRDSLYVHQRRTGRTEAHGGADGPVYAVDARSYGDFCAHMQWESPPAFESRNTLLPITNRDSRIRAVQVEPFLPGYKIPRLQQVAEPAPARRPPISKRVAHKDLMAPPLPPLLEEPAPAGQLAETAVDTAELPPLPEEPAPARQPAETAVYMETAELPPLPEDPPVGTPGYGEPLPPPEEPAAARQPAETAAGAAESPPLPEDDPAGTPTRGELPPPEEPAPARQPVELEAPVELDQHRRDRERRPRRHRSPMEIQSPPRRRYVTRTEPPLLVAERGATRPKGWWDSDAARRTRGLHIQFLQNELRELDRAIIARREDGSYRDEPGRQAEMDALEQEAGRYYRAIRDLQ